MSTRKKQNKSMLTPKQKRFLDSHDLGRFGVATKAGMPHVTPIIYAMDGDSPVIATDYGAKKLQILKENDKACLLVDLDRPHKGILLQGECEIYERGEEYLRLLKILFAKFSFYRKNPWGEGESPILRLAPSKIVDWSL